MIHFLDFILLFAMQIMFHVHIHMFDVSFLFFIYIINFAGNTLSSHMESWQVTFHSPLTVQSKCKTVIYIYILTNWTTALNMCLVLIPQEFCRLITDWSIEDMNYYVFSYRMLPIGQLKIWSKQTKKNKKVRYNKHLIFG